METFKDTTGDNVQSELPTETKKGLNGQVCTFDPSPLGTKEYWDSIYERDISIFNNVGDIGEIWFGKRVQTKIVDWIVKHFPKNSCESYICEIGCGNGALLAKLYNKIPYIHLNGLDYSESAIELANTCNPDLPIQWHVGDFLDTNDFIKKKFHEMFDLVIDKGTFDAMTLSGIQGILEAYKSSLAACIKSNTGIFILTSCNWTRNELIQMFSSNDCNSSFIVQEEILHDTPFIFQGNSGNCVTSIVFKYVHSMI